MRVGSSKIKIRLQEQELMEFIKKFKVVIAVVLIILVLVLIRSTGIYHFKNDAKKWAESSIKQSNSLTADEAAALPGSRLIINLDKGAISIPGLTGDVRNIPADSILDKNIISTILNHDSPVLLLSSEPGLSARIWMILSQMGCRNIYILTKSGDNEVLKYKFRPDTLTLRPEL
jgi:hypothetical protein